MLKLLTKPMIYMLAKRTFMLFLILNEYKTGELPNNFTIKRQRFVLLFDF